MSVVLISSSNNQLLVNLPVPIMWLNVMSVIPFNVTIYVCSSNASNSVIYNSICKPVSNFVSDCQSVKPVFKTYWCEL